MNTDRRWKLICNRTFHIVLLWRRTKSAHNGSRRWWGYREWKRQRVTAAAMRHREREDSERNERTSNNNSKSSVGGTWASFLDVRWSHVAVDAVRNEFQPGGFRDARRWPWPCTSVECGAGHHDDNEDNYDIVHVPSSQTNARHASPATRQAAKTRPTSPTWRHRQHRDRWRHRWPRYFHRWADGCVLYADSNFACVWRGIG